LVEVVIQENSSLKHKPWFNHPENPERVRVLAATLARMGFVKYGFTRVEPGLDESIRVAGLIHSRDYIERLLEDSKKGRVLLDEDTYISSDSVELALEALYLSYKTALEASGIRFLVIRPPGHHAGRRGRTRGVSSNGFCLFNNAAAAVVGFRERGFKRIGILDFDVHHGNGTMEIFYREGILQIDLHQHPDTLYPHTGYPDEIGEGEGFGLKVNMVFQPYTGDDSYMRALDYAENIIKEYNPDSLVVSAGFDGFSGDGLADLNLTEASYYRLGSLIREAGVPTVIVLEGGYSRGLENGFKAFLEGLAGVVRSYPHITSSRNISRLNEIVNRAVYEHALKRFGR